MKKLLNKLYFLNNNLFTVCAIIVFCIFTLPALLDTNHILYNLEPYPDGLVYALSGRNLALNQGFQLFSERGTVSVWTPPLYPLIFFGFYLLSMKIGMFFIANVLLHIIGIILLIRLLNKTVAQLWIRVVGLSIYFSHFVLFWLPTLPMSENLSLPLLILLITSYFETERKRKFLFALISSLGLLLTHYATFPLIFAGLIAILINEQALTKNKTYLVLFPLIIFGLFEIYLRLKNISMGNILVTLFQEKESFFSIYNIPQNTAAYVEMLTTSKGLFLWENIGVTNIILTGLFLFSLYFFFRKKEFKKILILGLLFFFQFPLQLVFYSPDARYIIYSLPLIVLGISWLLEAYASKQSWIIILVFLGVGIQLFLQQSFIRQVIASNIFQRSTAWQYEAIRHFNQNMPSEGILITALPPFLVNTYQNHPYRIVPMSQTQEFMDLMQPVWGDDVNYENLMETYRQWLTNERKIFISNAYITHQQSVTADFEQYKQNFNLRLVSSGCQEACNIYKLLPKETN